MDAKNITLQGYDEDKKKSAKLSVDEQLAIKSRIYICDVVRVLFQSGI